jgi:DNA ligase (NAD+)
VSSENHAVHSLGEAIAFHDSLAKRRASFPYEIDGIVVKVDDVSARARLRATARHPRWAIAYKFAPREAVSVVRDIVVQVGRTGVLTPVAVLDPVEIGGVTVKRATLHNVGEIVRKDLRVGDSVRVVRAGDVIPDVVARVPRPGERRGSPFRMPTRCPACGARIRKQGPFETCPADLSCPAQLVGAMVHFASRDALDIAGLGQETAQRLVESGLVKNVADLFVLRERDLVRLERFADLSAKNLVSGIEHAKHADLARFLYAIGIPEVGKATAHNLAEHFGDLDSIASAPEERLMEVEGVGPSVAQSITTFFQEPKNRVVIDACLARGVVLRAARAPSSGRLAGKKIVFTGTLSSMPRAEAEKRVRDLGGIPSSAVGASTSFVVLGAHPGSKLARARRLGISLLTEKQFLTLAGSAAHRPFGLSALASARTSGVDHG